MVQALSRSTLQPAIHTTGSQLVQTDCAWIKVELDRNAWPNRGKIEVVQVAIEIDEGRGFHEIASFGASGGERPARDGAPSPPTSAITIKQSKGFRAGTLIRVVIDAKEVLDTAVRLTWGT